MKLYKALACAVGAKARCEAINKDGSHDEAIERWETQIKALLKEFPHGSGFDNGTQLDEASTGEKLVFQTAFHHMDEGMYDGWTEHTITITPSLEMDFTMKISGRDRNDIKELISQSFDDVLNRKAH